MGSVLDEVRLNRMIDNDQAVGKNYRRLASQGLEDVYEKESPNLTIGEFRERSIGELKQSIQNIFSDLILNGLGNPLSEGTFRFDKGTSKSFRYLNLSGGEKAAFDLILDFIVKKREFDNTIFCIDEPETHMNSRLQGKLLDELYRLIPENCQLWLATHSIGMMRRSKDLSKDNPDTVYFYDFDGKDFDQSQRMSPVLPNRNFWERTLNVALDDLSDLIAPHKIVICEGAPKSACSGANAEMDANCYDRIFESEFPDTKFISVGNAHSVIADRLAFVGDYKKNSQ